MKKQQKQNSLKTDFKLIARGFRLLYEISPRNMIWRTVNCLAQQISPYFALYMSALLIDAVAAGKPLSYLAVLAGITVGGSLFLNLVIHGIGRKAWETENLNWQLNELHLLKAQCRMQYKHYEDPKTALLRQTIRNHANYGGHGLSMLYWVYWKALGSVFNLVVSVSLTFSILRTVSAGELSGFLRFVNSPYSALFLVVLIALNIAVGLFRVSKFDKKSTRIWGDYNIRFARSNGYMVQNLPEMRVFGAREFTLKRNRDVLLDESYKRTLIKLGVQSETLYHIATAALNIGLALYVGAKAFIGVFGIGSYVLYRGTVEKFVNAVSDLASAVGRLRLNNPYLEELFTFLDLPDEMYKGSLSVEKRDDNRFEIEFRDVSFKYPGADTYALKHVNFKFKIGERLAFVGMNGSGKSTFIKLLCRLYDPTEGTILLNGIDITRYNYDQYIALFSLVFQDFSVFSFSLGENIAVSEQYDAKKVTEALEKVGFGERLAHTKNGLDSAIGKLYDNEGEDFSGGERQKIALARALYKNAPFFILDEPTAALDPIAEAEVYSRFSTIVGEKTAIFISHRLSSCRFCDKIVVFDQGALTQFGSHDDLVADKNGKYHELWNAQAQYYTQ